jgi:PAS domain S-box-containing protein
LKNQNLVAERLTKAQLNDHQQIVDQLQKSEKRYRLLAENAADVIWTVDFRNPTQLTYVSPSVTRLLGYTIEEAFTTTMDEVFSPPSYKIAFETLYKVLAVENSSQGNQNEMQTLELELIHKNGSIIPVEVSYSLIRAADGIPEEILAVVRDIRERKRVEQELQLYNEKLLKSMEDMIQSIARIVEVRDPYTAGHQKRTAQLAVTIGEELKLPKDQIKGLRLASSIHDIGKIQVPSEILSKPDELSGPEFSIIKMHPLVGSEIVKHNELPWPISTIILQHHERMDGSGYPSGLKGENIILEAKILAVADVVEAMSSHRPYRPSQGIEKALEYISFEKGRLFDSDVVDACLKIFPPLKSVYT